MLKIIGRPPQAVDRFVPLPYKGGTQGVREGGVNPPLPRNCKREEPEHVPLGDLLGRRSGSTCKTRASQETGHELAYWAIGF